MKIHVLGGGPAGLYFSALVKKAEPDADVALFERDAPDDTFGWGVVFSDETLGNLRDADQESYEAIARGFAYWDAIDIHVRGRSIRSRGHGFCGIARPRLLQILADRAEQTGVKLHFRTPVDDVEKLRDCDLLVAADGIHSACRTRWEDRFRPSFEPGRSRFIWLGSRQKLGAFTFSFRENEHGVFQIHAYQFEPDTSTFIVECDEETWRRAGLDTADERKSIEYCQAVFAEELGGHELMGNRSRWTQFVTVSNEHWHHENVVLMGDAAHTAHFSVGSGTKLAMEDSIALAETLARHRRDIFAALQAYEDDRRPLVGRTQKAASQSRQWFEQAGRHLSAPPDRFAFDLLTRTRRVTHDNLKKRDPTYIEQVDRWYMREQGVEGADDPNRPIVPALFVPFELRGMQLDNRIVVSPMCQYSAEDGTPNEWHLVHLGCRAIGGAGLLFTEMTDVSREGRISPGCTGMYKDEHVREWSRIVDFVHASSGAKIALQIAHAGRKGSTRVSWEGSDEPLPEGNWEIIGPSPLPWTPRNQVPREMTRDDMVKVRGDFVRAAQMALRCGFDMLELHFAHGYLLSSFLTPVSNRRSDRYGGSLRNRARFPLEVFDAVREVWNDKPLSVRMSATDWVPDGFDVEDAVELAEMLKDHGVDILDVSAGQTSPDAQPVYGRAFQMPFSERIRNDVGIPTITVGNIWTADQVNTILMAGRADLVALARAHLADPYWTLHAAAALGHGVASQLPPQYHQAGLMMERLFEPEGTSGPDV